jgi:hypothetical protein
MSQPRHAKRQLPAWVWGLFIAIVIFAIVIFVARTLGFGDDPAIGAMASLVSG